MRFFYVLIIVTFTICVQAQNYPIGSQSFSYNDPARGSTVTGDVYYPATTSGTNTPVASGQFPVIVFGHGFGISTTEYDVWWNELVPCGYILVLPDTEGSIFPAPNHDDFGKDMAFLIDIYLNENNNSSSPFLNHISGKTAVMGHSMGGGCAFLAAAANPNITTMITLAAAETNTSAIAAAANITIPSLTIAGSADCVVMNGGAPIDMYNNIGTPYKAYLDITNGSHCQFSKNSAGSICSFGEFCGGFIPIASQHMQMFDLSKPWLDYFLKMSPCSYDVFYNYAFPNSGSIHTFQDNGTVPVIQPMPAIVSNVTGGSAVFSWSPIPGANVCLIEYRIMGTTTWMSATTVGTSLTVVGLVNNMTYEYRKSVDCGNGFGPPSNLSVFTNSNCVVSHTLPTVPITTLLYEAQQFIESTATINANANITFHAGNYVLLDNNFMAMPNVQFVADIVPCTP